MRITSFEQLQVGELVRRYDNEAVGKIIKRHDLAEHITVAFPCYMTGLTWEIPYDYLEAVRKLERFTEC